MPKLAKRQSEILKRQPIDESGPGTILRDFQTLLDFVGTGGVKTGGKNYRLPLATLGELDERMSHPLRPRKSRPQQLSYPHLNGLYLLLRTSGLCVSRASEIAVSFLSICHVSRSGKPSITKHCTSRYAS